MARFLSPAWFEEVERHAPGRPPASDLPAGAPSDGPLVLRQVVRGTPDGEVSYHVIVEPGSARIVGPGAQTGPPDLTITTDWDTAAAIAQGKLAAQVALIEGRLRVKGNLAAVAENAGGLPGLDPVPPAVRDHTTY